LRFRYQCGLSLDRPAPSVSTLSRVFDQLVQQNLVQQLFDDLVKQCLEEGIIDGQHVAIDSAAIEAYEKKQPKSRSAQTGNANWGAKFDAFGNKLTWFGYKVHLAVDTHSELPIALEVTPAHVNDGEQAPDLMAQSTEILDTKPKYFIMDAGYDQDKVYQSAYRHGAQAIRYWEHRL
ncbi:transposase IS4 family protein, partial [Caldalkalibacillus thermarum TA2.A1]